MSAQRVLAAALLLLAACSRDLTVPPDPQPGKLTGRVVYAVPGRSDLRPANGASVQLLGTSLGATANQAGTFSLAPLEQTDGVLLFAFDSNGDGVIDRQRTERLEDWKTGKFRQVDMGDVALGENASIHGRVRLADQPGAKTGLSGSAVFVPGGPFTAYTGDDGSFTLANLPPGPIEVVVFRAGYAAQSLGTLDLRPAEDFGARDVVLEKSADTMPGSIAGTLAFSPVASGKGDSAVTAGTSSATVGDDLKFELASVPAGLYVVTATRTGYSPAKVPNVLVLPGKQTTLGAVLVTDRPIPDGGVLPAQPDAGGGTGDAGTDGGTADGGLDAGPCVGANCTPCLTNAQCALTEWCDNNFCAPQCSATNPCSNGRFCESATKTCVVPCNGNTCGPNAVCQNNVCRSACSGSFPCPAGQACTAGLCGPECSATLPCTAQHLTCSGGQCVPKMSCSNDFDCAQTQMCLQGQCKTRLTSPTDAGEWPCTGACQCRLGEWCTEGFCAPDVAPTVWFAADGGGTGASRQSPAPDLAGRLADAGPNTVFGLRDGDRFYSDGPFVIRASRITVAGGFVDCGDDRWVRSETTRSVLFTDAGVVVSMQGQGAFPLENVALSNLKVQTAATAGCADDAISATDTSALSLARIEGGLEAVNDCSSVPSTVTSLVDCLRCTDFAFTDLHLKDTVSRKNALMAVSVGFSSGTMTRLVVDPPSTIHSSLYGFGTDAQIGVVKVEDSTFPTVTAGGSGSSGVYGTTCGNHALQVVNSQFSFAKSLVSQNYASGVDAINCAAVEVRDNLFDGSALSGPLYPGNYGVSLNNSGGVVERNVIHLPQAQNDVVVAGVYATGTGNLLTVRDNVVTGGTGVNADGLRLLGLSSPAVATGNFIDVGPATKARAIALGGPSFRVSDNFARATGINGCSGFAFGVTMNDARGVLERNRFFASKAPVSRGLSSDGASTGVFELYSSHLWAGPASCNGESTAMLTINSGPNGNWLAGNTLDAEGTSLTNATTAAIGCASVTLTAQGNVFGGGGASTRKMIGYASPECVAPSLWSKNYFWVDHMTTAVNGADGMGFVAVSNTIGMPDGNGNVFNGNTSPFDPSQPLFDGGVAPRERPLGALVVDRPPLVKQLDGSPLWLDVDRRPRDAGAGPDLGCCERY